MVDYDYVYSKFIRPVFHRTLLYDDIYVCWYKAVRKHECKCVRNKDGGRSGGVWAGTGLSTTRVRLKVLKEERRTFCARQCPIEIARRIMNGADVFVQLG